jgi:hypothetical protein
MITTKAVRKALSLLFVANLAAAPLAIAGPIRTMDPATTGPRDARGFGPIGVVYSLRPVRVAGHLASGPRTLWRGDEVVTQDSAAQVELEGVARISLSPGSSLRLFTSSGFGQQERMVALVNAGQILFDLASIASASVETGDLTVSADGGSRFRVRVVDGIGSVEAISGVLRSERRPQIDIWVLTPVTVTPQGIPTGTAPPRQRVKKGNTGTVAVQAKRGGSRGGGGGGLLASLVPVAYVPQQPDPQTAAARTPIRFCLSDLTVGVLLPGRGQCETVPTNSAGVAIVLFQAGPTKGVTKITASVLPPAQGSWTGEIEVIDPFWTWQKKLLVGAAAAVGGTVCAFKCGSDRGPLQQAPPPSIP